MEMYITIEYLGDPREDVILFRSHDIIMIAKHGHTFIEY